MSRIGLKHIGAIVLLFPIIIWVAFEALIDPFPNSLWLVRLLSTNYLVSVSADLEVDGEKLKLERTFRCFKPYDYKWLASAETQRDWPTNGQAGDIIAVETSKGRLFAISVPMACGILSDGTTPFAPVANPNELVLSRNEIRTPVIFEVHGGKNVERIDAYISRDKLREGYHGLKLIEFKLTRSSGVLWNDSNGYDWVGLASWIRPQGADATFYMAGFLMAVPENRWDEVDQGKICVGCKEPTVGWSKAYSNFINQYRSAQENVVIQTTANSPNPFERLLAKFLYRYPRSTPASYDLNFPGEKRVYDNYQITQWVEDYIVPCLGDEYGSQFECMPELSGVLIYSQHKMHHPRNSSPYANFKVGDLRFSAKDFEAHLIDPKNGILYTSGEHLTYWRK